MRNRLACKFKRTALIDFSSDTPEDIKKKKRETLLETLNPQGILCSKCFSKSPPPHLIYDFNFSKNILMPQARVNMMGSRKNTTVLWD